MAIKNHIGALKKGAESLSDKLYREERDFRADKLN